MGANSVMPKPPPGFVLDAEPVGVPPPPPGFVLDEEAAAPEVAGKPSLLRRVAQPFVDAAFGATEAATSFATGIASMPVAGLGGLAKWLTTKDVEEAQKTQEQIAGALTHQPISPYGQFYTEKAGQIMGAPAEAVRAWGAGAVEGGIPIGLPEAGEEGLTVPVSPAVATAMTTPAELAAYVLPFKLLKYAKSGKPIAVPFEEEPPPEPVAEQKPSTLKTPPSPVGERAPLPTRMTTGERTEAKGFAPPKPKIAEVAKEEPAPAIEPSRLIRREIETGKPAPLPPRLKPPKPPPGYVIDQKEILPREQVAEKIAIEPETKQPWEMSFDEFEKSAKTLSDISENVPGKYRVANYMNAELKVGEPGETHWALAERHGVKNWDKIITGFVDKDTGEFIYQYRRPNLEAVYRNLVEQAKEAGVEKKPEIGETLDFLGMQQAYQRLTSPAARQSVASFATKFKEFWQPFSTMLGGEKALGVRYEAMGNIARAERFMGRAFERLDSLPDQAKKDVFWFLDGKLPQSALPLDIQNYAASLKNATNRIGQMLVKRGIIKQEQYDALKGRYVHYMYAKHLLGDETPVGVGAGGKLDLSYARSRKDLTMDQRKGLGLIDDASIAAPIGLGKALTDIMKYDALKKYADNPEWTWQPSMVQVPRLGGGNPVSMGIGELVKEVERYRKTATEMPTPEVVARYQELQQALNQAIQATANVPADFVQLPTAKTYGPLSGTFVRRSIADDLQPIMAAMEDRARFWKVVNSVEKQGMAYFKMMKVALNIPTAVRNVGSNIIQVNLRGTPLNEIPRDVVSGAQSMLAKDALYEQAFRGGLFKTNWHATEISEVLNEFKKAQGGTMNDIIQTVSKLARYYGKIDDVTKMAIFKRAVTKEGMAIPDAILEAQKWGMDYSLASRSVKHARQWVMPFLSYQYKIAPLIAEAIAKRPWVFAKYAALPFIVEEATRQYNDMDDKDWKRLMKQVPYYVKDAGSGMILPIKNDKGKYEWVNLEYFFPWANTLALTRDIGKAKVGEIWRDLGISNPFLSMAYLANSAVGGKPPKHPYTGMPIWNLNDAPGTKMRKFVETVIFNWAPQMLSQQGALGYSYRAAKGEKDKWGRDVTPAQAVGRWFGLNIIQISPQQTAAIKKNMVNELKADFYRIRSDPSISVEEKRAAARRLRENIKKVVNE